MKCGFREVENPWIIAQHGQRRNERDPNIIRQKFHLKSVVMVPSFPAIRS